MCEELGDYLKPYMYGKGTLRFPANEPIAHELVKRIVQVLLDERGEGTASARADDRSRRLR